VTQPPDAIASRIAIAREPEGLECSLRALEKQIGPAMALAVPDRVKSARDLVHDVALRQHELRGLRVKLSRLGLSSLGRSEGCVMASLLLPTPNPFPPTMRAVREVGRRDRKIGR
jgi:hypothetical protein